MSNIVDNLLDKLDKIKKKVTADPELNEKDAKVEVSTAENNDVELKKNPEKAASPKRRRPASRGSRKKRATVPKKQASPKAAAEKSSDKTVKKKSVKRSEPSHIKEKSSSVVKTGKKETAGQKTTEPTVKLLINTEEPEECRIALIEDGRIESFHMTSVIHEHTKSNIYKGKVTAIEPNLQAAFVDIGGVKNGFLPFAEIHPEYYTPEKAAQKHWKDLNIQDVIKKGQDMLVQVVKEAIGSKGASMTTYLSLPGRSLVLMPGSDSAGISRKIDDEEQRTKLRKMMNTLNIPEGIGFIIRTASQDITKTALNKDLNYLLRLWDETKKLGQSAKSPALLYKDQDIIAKVLRDYYSPEIKEILVDTQEAYDKVGSFIRLLPVKQRKTTVKLHHGSRPIFNQYGVEDQIEQIYQPVVRLPSGGSIVINPTEALVAIDVNSGSTAKDKNFAETIFLANMEAAAELARQLRLRDLGGLIVVDFIDMRNSRHIREVEKQVKASMKRDRAKVDISRISRFGLMQISRQKMGQPIQVGSYNICDHCHGRGITRSVETQSLFYLRRIQTGVTHKHVVEVNCRLPVKVAQYLLNNKREELLEMERKYDTVIRIETAPEMAPADHKIEFVRKQD
jgi:ribonuclease E